MHSDVSSALQHTRQVSRELQQRELTDQAVHAHASAAAHLKPFYTPRASMAASIRPCLSARR